MVILIIFCCFFIYVFPNFLQLRNLFGVLGFCLSCKKIWGLVNNSQPNWSCSCLSLPSRPSYFLSSLPQFSGILGWDITSGYLKKMIQNNNATNSTIYRQPFSDGLKGYPVNLMLVLLYANRSPAVLDALRQGFWLRRSGCR